MATPGQDSSPISTELAPEGSTVILGAYVVVQGYTLEGITVLGLAAIGLPLMIGWIRTELRRFARRNARPE